MELGSLKQLIGRVRAMVPGRRIIVFGSSSLFATFPDEPPVRLGLELTLDADFLIDPDDAELRDRLLQSLGRDKDFHDATGFYGDFVDLRTSENFPPGWRERLVPMPGCEGVVALAPVDMSVAKIGATASTRLARRLASGNRDRGMKDIRVVRALLRAGHITVPEIEQRQSTMNYQPAMIVEAGQVLDEISARPLD